MILTPYTPRLVFFIKNFRRSLLWLAGLIAAATFAYAQMAPPPPVQATASAANRTGNPLYAQVYRVPKPEEVTAVLDRVRACLESGTPSRVVAGRGGPEITDFSQPVPGAALESGAQFPFPLLTYEQGVVFVGMLAAGQATGDAKYNDFVAKRLTALANLLKVSPPTPAPVAGAPMGRGGFGTRALTAPASLDQCGALCLGFLKARQAGVGPDLSSVTNTWMKYITTTLFRLPDGTIARHIPMPESLWADDMYMSVPALAQMGRITGDRKYFDDAAKQVEQFAARLFRPEKGIFVHGWISTNPDTIDIHWARANGWCVMAMAELLDVLPKDHPAYDTILNLFRAHVRGLAACQSADGLWHQLLDRTDSYLETSASAMFVYAIAHGIDQGWISPAYGTVALTGWNAVAMRVNDQGQVEGTCVGTDFGLTLQYYYYRGTSVLALHGYGPTLLAGAEILNLLRNDKINIAMTNIGSLYVSPKPGTPMPWLETGRPGGGTNVEAKPANPAPTNGESPKSGSYQRF